MARYIDADRLMTKIHELYVQPNIELWQVVKCVGNAPTADVVPKSEVESVLNEIEKTIRGALILIDFGYKHNVKEKQCKKECCEDFLGYIAELKKKYTEEV